MSDENIKKSKTEILAKMPEEAVLESLELMREKGTSTVFFMTSESAEICEKHEEAAEIIHSCDMILPGDKAIEEAVFSNGGLYVKEDSSREYLGYYLEYLLFRLQKENRVILVIVENQEMLENYQKLMERYENIQAVGYVFKDYDNTVNEINAVIPDVLLFATSFENQIGFLKDYKAMMNAHLILSCSDFSKYLKAQTGSVPSIIKALHLEDVYHWIKKDVKTQKGTSED